MADRFATWGLNVPHEDDAAFLAAWRASAVPLIPLVAPKTPGALQFQWKAYVCCWAAMQALRLEGDLVECRANYGILSHTVAGYIGLAQRPDRTLWLYDTFRGIPAEQMTAREARGLGTWHNANNYMDEVFEIARHRFARSPNARLVRGRVPETLAEAAPGRVAFLHLDMNIVHPEIAAAELFWERMPAFQAFAAERGQLVLPLPKGQGVMVKA